MSEQPPRRRLENRDLRRPVFRGMNRADRIAAEFHRKAKRALQPKAVPVPKAESAAAEETSVAEQVDPRRITVTQAYDAMLQLHRLLARKREARGGDEGRESAAHKAAAAELRERKARLLPWLETAAMEMSLSDAQKTRLISLLLYGRHGADLLAEERETVARVRALDGLRGQIENGERRAALERLAGPADPEGEPFPAVELACTEELWSGELKDGERRQQIASFLGDDDADPGLVQRVDDLIRTWSTDRYASYAATAKEMIRRLRDIAPGLDPEARNLLIALDLVDQRSGREVLASIARQCGFRIGRLQLLGRGGMGEVLKLTETGDDPRTVLAKIPQDGAEFGEEGALYAEVHGSPMENPRPDLTMFMEYLEGARSLHECRETTPEEWAGRSLRLVRAIRAETEAKGIVHRDIKPRNILVDPDGGFHVIDYGLARRIKRGAVLKDEDVKGTREYLPYEALQQRHSGTDVRVGGRTDAYGTGCILFELAASKRLFDVLKQEVQIPPCDPEEYEWRLQRRVLEEPDIVRRIVDARCAALTPQERELLCGLLHPDEKQRLTLAKAEAALKKLKKV